MRKLPYQNITEKQKVRFGNIMSMYVGLKTNKYTMEEALKKNKLLIRK